MYYQLHQQQFVISLTHFGQNRLNDFGCFVGLAHIQKQCCQFELDPMLKVGSLFPDTPLNHPLAQLDLQFFRAWHLGNVVNQSLGDFGEAWFGENA